jgi:hypothetical protein
MAAVVLLAILLILAVIAGLWYWNQQRQLAMEQQAYAALRNLSAIVQLDTQRKHVSTVMIRQNLADALPRVAELNYLSHLDLADTQFTDDDADYLIGLPRLVSLDVSHTLLTDEGVEKLAAMPLESLTMVGTKISGEALNTLGDIHSLKVLNLSQTKVQDNLGALDGLQRLEWIYLDGVDLRGVSDTTLDQLAQMPLLRRLTLTNTGISQRAIDRLRSAKPGMQLDVGEQVQTVAPSSAPSSAPSNGSSDASSDASSDPLAEETAEGEASSSGRG